MDDFDDLLQTKISPESSVSIQQNKIQSAAQQQVNDVRSGRKHQQTEPLAPNFSWMDEYQKISGAPQMMKPVSGPSKLSPKPVFKPKITSSKVPTSPMQVQSLAPYITIPSSVSSTVHSNPRDNIKKPEN